MHGFANSVLFKVVFLLILCYVSEVTIIFIFVEINETDQNVPRQ